MLNRLILAVSMAAGLNVRAQDLMQVSTSWSEMVAGTNTPVLTPNGVLEAGEGALIQVGTYALHNGTNAIGQTTNHNHPIGSGVGVIRSIGSIVYSLAGTGADATGSWTQRAITPVLPAGAHTGYLAAGGARVNHFGGAQSLPPGTTADGTNPIAAMWRGVWNPNSYEQRTVHFHVEPSKAVPTGQHNALYLQVGTGYLVPGDPSTAYPIYLGHHIPADFGTGVDIPIGPGSSPFTYLCYPDCDGVPEVNANDILCFVNLYASGSSLANCDGSNRTPLLTANDLICYLNRFAAGCT